MFFFDFPLSQFKPGVDHGVGHGVGHGLPVVNFPKNPPKKIDQMEIKNQNKRMKP